MIILLFVLSFFLLLFINVPISICLSLSSVFYLILTGNISLINITASRIFSGLNNFTMLAIPLFVLSGDLLYNGKASKALVNLANSIAGSFKGGLSTVTTVSCMMFGAVSGSGAATASAIGAVISPEVEEHGYDKTFIAAIIALAGPLGILIPPSIPMVVYGATTNTSIGQLLLSGIAPGILFGAIIICYGYFISKKYNYGSIQKFDFKKVLTSFKDAFWALLTPVIIIGGIYSGRFTPTEAAVVAVIWALIVGLFIYKTLKLKDLPKIFLNSAVTSSTIMFVVGGVVMFGWVLTREQIPQMISKVMLSNVHSPLMFLMISNVIILLAGMLMDPSPALILFAPLLLPVAISFNIDPVYFGALMVANLAIGLVTPPVALTLYVSARICDVPLKKLIPVVIVPVMLLMMGLILITLLPDIVMFLPNLFY